MRRADRLFQIVQVLRRAGRPVTAAAIAAELEVSLRTVYRDVAELMAQRVPIRGEAGLGYVLGPGFDMPPLMLTPDEVEAAALGAQWVAGRGDPVLAVAARDLLAKIAAVLPEPLRALAAEPTVAAAPRLDAPDGVPADSDLAWLRAAIRQGRKVRIGYRDAAGRESERTVWPVVIGYVDSVRLLAAWCEDRGAFRHFRIDRIDAAQVLDERHGRRPGVLRREWQRVLEAERAADAPQGPWWAAASASS
jgi:predicted DNA-binding transcriptional regulator YafY